MWRNIGIGAIGLALSAFGAWLVSQSIQRDTFGFEPAFVASLYREREGMLHAVKEGIVAIDNHGIITLMNPAASTLLLAESSLTNDEIVEKLGLLETVKTGLSLYDDNRVIAGKSLIVNCHPLFEGDVISGAICSFRDRTDMKQLKETMIQLQIQSDGMRAQTHEFKNKLYVLLGLLQLRKIEDALSFITQETKLQQTQTTPLFKKIKDTGIQALLLAKMAKASEKHINLYIEESSELNPIRHIPLSDLSIILGNVLDNAIEAVGKSEKKEIVFYVSDVGSDIVMDIYDRGPGINHNQMIDVFEQGTSTKGKDRGFGLSNVRNTVKKWGGFVEVKTSEDDWGTIVSIYIPKKHEE